MTVLVTGATGFVGPHVVHALRAREICRAALVRDPKRAARLTAWGVELARVTSPTRRRCAMRSRASTRSSISSRSSRGRATTSSAIMVQGTRNVVAAAQEAGVRRFVLASALGLDERSRDAVPYFAAKWEMERAVEASGLEHVIFRPSFVFGKDGGVLPTFVRLARFAPVTPIVGTGRSACSRSGSRTSRSTTPAPSMCPEAAGRTFELGGPDAPTWNEFWDRLKRVLGVRRPSIHLPLGLMRAQATLTERLPGAPVTRDQLTMLAARRQRRHRPGRGRDVPAAARAARRAASPRRIVTRGLVYAEPGSPPAVEEITLDPPGPNEVQVRVEAAASATPISTSSRPAAGG